MKQENNANCLLGNALDFEQLPETMQWMLAEAVDEYVIALEEGCELDRESLLSKYDSIREPLKAYLEQIDWLHGESNLGSTAGKSLNTITTSGLVYGDFDIECEIGRGSMGIVYKAFQKSLQRWVAIKVLPYGTLLDEHRTQRFWREARIAGALEHPGIVSVYGFGRHQDICFYAMAIVEGRSLDRHIRDAALPPAEYSNQNRQPLPPPEGLILGPDRFRNIAKMVADAADAIHAAHAAGVIHRDIKPSNLIVDLHGRVKVTDFGLAVDTADLGLTRSGEVVGTIRYMSPEQAAGKRGLVDQRSDVYCLGATLYELLTLFPPFNSESLAEVVREKEEGRLTPPRSIDPSIPRALQTVTLKAMRADPRERYQSAKELADDLKNILSGKPITACDQSLLELSTGWARRNAGVVLTAALALAILFLLALIFNIAQQTQQVALSNALAAREKNFQNARRAVDQLGIQFAEKLELVPEASELRRDILRRSLDYYSEFLNESKDDPNLAMSVAEAKWKTAQATAGLESLEEGAKRYEETDAELAELVRKHPNLVSVRAEMLSDWAMRYMGRFQGEALQPNTALEILDRISSDDQRLNKTSQALLKNNRAIILAALGQLEESIRFAREAVDLLKEYQGIDSPNPDSNDVNARSLCKSMLNLSQSLDKAGKPHSALEVARQCANFAEKITSKSTATHSSQLRANALATLATLQWKHQGPQAAIDGLQSVVHIHETLLEARPSSIECRWDLAVALNNLGMAISAYSDSNDSLKTAAIQAFEKAYAIAKAETEADTQSSLAAQRAANIQNNLGLLLRKMRRFPEADHALRCAKLHIDRAAELDSQNEGIVKSRDRIDLNIRNH